MTQEVTGRKVELVTFLCETNTNNDGFFSVAHNLDQQFSPDAIIIEAISVAVLHQNGNWHSLEISNRVDNRFWWTDTVVQGLIASPYFHNRPVKVVVFALPTLG